MTTLAEAQAALADYAADQGLSIYATRLWVTEDATGQQSLVTGLDELPAITTPPPPPPPDGWSTTVFFEDFSGGLSNWHVRNGTTQLNTYCNNFAANVEIVDGQLVITGRAEVTTVATSEGPRTCDWTSGYVDTGAAGLLSVEKGSRVEIVATLPTVLGGTAKGLWPAGWFRDKIGAGEIDLFEAWGEPTTHTGYRTGSFSSSVYANTDDAADGKVSNWGTAVGAPAVGGVEHLHWLEWDDDGIRIGFEDNPPHVNARYAALPWLAAAFPSTLELRLNLQIGDNYWGMPDGGTEFPAEFKINSVTVYRP